MPPIPVDDHTEEFEDLAGLSALDMLEGQERARFEEHATRCERCRLMVQLDREALARAAPEMDPSPDFKARLMQRAAAELAERQQQPEPIPLRPARALPGTVVPLWRRSPWMSAIAAILVVGVFTFGGYAYQNQTVASYALSGSVPGSAVVNVKRSGATSLDMRGVANPPPGQVYEAWIIPRGGAPVAAGITSTGDASLPLTGVQSGDTIAVTQERQQMDAPTLPILLSGVVQS